MMMFTTSVFAKKIHSLIFQDYTISACSLDFPLLSNEANRQEMPSSASHPPGMGT